MPSSELKLHQDGTELPIIYGKNWVDGPLPAISIDEEGGGLYIKLSSGTPSETREVASGDQIILLDFDDCGQIVGVEILGEIK